MALNVSPHIPQVVVNASAPTTEALQRTNAQREVVPAPVQVEAAVPQKTREQEARGAGSASSNADVTYENIARGQGRIIPEDVNEQGGDGQGDSGQDSSSQGRNGQGTDGQNENGLNGQASNDDSSSNASNSESSDTEASEQKQAQERQQKQEQQQEQQQEKQELREIRQLETRDQEVRTHELAHAAVGGAYAGSPTYEYETGPNGKKYAVGGEVQIDVSKEATPQETIEKMQTVRAAALAPAEPSTQDRKVAAEASQNIAEARIELMQDTAERRDATAASVSESFAERDESISRVAEVVSQKYQASFGRDSESKSDFSAVA